MNIRKMVFTALFAALIACGSFINLPIGPVPIVLSTLFIVLAGLILGPWSGTLAVLIYLLIGILGLPVFAGGTGGIAVLYGPTGGYLVGYIMGAAAAGLIVHLLGQKIQWLILGGILGSAIIYLPGVTWLKTSLEMKWSTALGAGLIPFIPGDILKTGVAVAIAFFLGKRLLNADEESRY